MNQFLQILVSGLVLGAVYGMTALGFGIVYNATRVINFAHGEFVMMGGLITAVLATNFHHESWLAACEAVVVVATLGAILDRVIIQNARRREHLTLVMITISAASIFRGLMEAVVGRDVYFTATFPGATDLHVGEIYISGQAIWVVLTLAVISTSLYVLLHHTRLGKGMRAAASNERAARLYGIDPGWMSTVSYAIAGGIGAAAGAVIVPLASGYYQTGLYFGLKGFAAAILGGLGNPFGAIVGGMMIGVLENLASGYVSSGYKDSIALGLLLVLLLFRPSGLFNLAEAKRV